MKPCDQNLLRTLDLTNEMIKLANQGDIDREDVGCGIIYGILRDSGYKIRKLVEEELDKHHAKRLWEKKQLSSYPESGSKLKL